MTRSVHLFNFHGVTPKKDDSLLEAAGSMLAENVDLSRGDLEPFLWGGPLAGDGDQIDIKSFYDIEGNFCSFKTWDYYTDVIEGRPDHFFRGDVFWIEGSDIRFTTSGDICNDVSYSLTVQNPPDAPTVASNETSEKGCQTVASFCYTNVDLFGRESQPSPPSPVIPMEIIDTASVTVAAAEPDIYYRRIYRSMAGSTTGAEPVINAGGDWVFVGETNNRNSHTFTVSGLESVAFTLPSTRWGMPPTDPTCIAFCANTNVLVVGSLNTVHISQPGQYHAFPHDRDIVLPDQIVAIREYDGDIIVLTDGHPAILTPIKEREGAAHYEVLRGDESYPCLNPASVAVGTTGVIWASTDGLFVIGRSRAGLTVQSISSEVFHYRDWRKSDPASIRGEVYNSAYYFTSDSPVVNAITGRSSYTWVLSYDETVYQNPTNVHLQSLSIRPSMWGRTRRDKLYFSEGGYLYEWNSDVGLPRPYDYISRDLVETGLANYSAAKVVNDGDGDLKFELWRELSTKSVLLYSRDITHSEPFRLPRTNLSVDHYVRLTGTSRVRRVHLASSYDELTLAQDSTMTHGNTRVTAR